MAAETYTVVVADDEQELREAVCSMIRWEEIGFRLVGSAGNGLDALQLVEQLQPDLLLTDIQMPFIPEQSWQRVFGSFSRSFRLHFCPAMMILNMRSAQSRIASSLIF